MNRRRFLVLVAASASLYGQRATSSGDVLKVWLPDGAGIEIYTTSSGPNTPLSTSGAVLIGRGNIFRAVIGENGSVLFAYAIDGKKLDRGGVSLRMLPVDQQQLKSLKWLPTGKPLGSVPTLAAVREFPSLQPGDAVELDILYHPATHEKIWDVIRVSSATPAASQPKQDQPRGNQFSFQEVRVVVNGKTIQEPRNNWIIGQAAVIKLPERGNFYLTLSPPVDYPFKASGWVDHNILRFQTGDELVEIIGKSNVLQKSEYGTVWIYHETEIPHLKSELARLRLTYTAQHPRVKLLEAELALAMKIFAIQTAEEVESLIPKKVKQREE